MDKVHLQCTWERYIIKIDNKLSVIELSFYIVNNKDFGGT